MELYEALMTTRSMRRLTDDPPVTDEEIEHCLRAAAQAPSGGNVQPYHFVVITDPEARAAMADLYLRGWRRYRPAMVAALPPFPTPEAEGSFRRSVDLSEHLAEHLADTPSVLFCLASFDSTLADDEGPLDVGTLHASIFPAVQSFILAARDLGLGTTLTTVFRVHNDEVREAFGLPPHLDPVALVPIGRPIGPLRRRAPQADREDHPLEPLRTSAVPSSPRPGRRPTAEPRQERRTSSSAIWMALSAAPLRRLSFDTNSARPRASARSRPGGCARRRPGPARGLQRRRDVGQRRRPARRPATSVRLGDARSAARTRR